MQTETNNLLFYGETSIVEYSVQWVLFTLGHNVIRTQNNSYKYYMQIHPVTVV